MKIVFGIPTYNGSKYIEQTLLSIVEQIPELDSLHKVEVLVQDNGSTDNTCDIVNRVAERFLTTVRYQRNESNLGYDRNVLKLFESANGDYLKLIGDDDVLRPGGLRKIIETISQYAPIDVAVYNFEVVDEFLQASGPCHSLIEGASRTYKSGDEFVDQCALRFGQLSAVLFRIDKLKTLNLTAAIGTQYLHIAALFEMGPNICGLIVGAPVIYVRRGSPNFEKSTADRLLIPLASIQIYRKAKDRGWNIHTLKKLVRFNQKYALRRIVSARADGLPWSLKTIHRLASECWDYPSFWLLFLPLMFLPKNVANLIRRVHATLQPRTT